MAEEVKLLLPPQNLAARRHFFEEVATGGGTRFHRSTPATPLASHRETLGVGLALEKCLSENSLSVAQETPSTMSASDGNISTQILQEDEVASSDVNLHKDKSDEESSGGGGPEEKMTGVTGEQLAEGLILPKKVQNPCLESSDRQRLHRELMLNQKLGKNVLNQKSELQRAMEKYKDNQFRKELEQQKQDNMTPLERVIEQRAKRLEILERDTLNDKEIAPKEPEFLQIHAKMRARMDAK